MGNRDTLMIVVSSEGELVYFMFFLLPLPGHSVNSGMSLNVSPQERMQQRWSLGRSACSLQPTGDTECRSAASSITPLLQPAGRVPRNPDVSHGLSFLPARTCSFIRSLLHSHTCLSLCLCLCVCVSVCVCVCACVSCVFAIDWRKH